jgi:hypothetical protein
MKIQCRTRKGGSVLLNGGHRVWASYAVASVAKRPPPELFYAGATLPNGRRVEFFLNRETGLVAVDVIAVHGQGGSEVVRLNANAVHLPSGAECRAVRRKDRCHSMR